MMELGAEILHSTCTMCLTLTSKAEVKLFSIMTHLKKNASPLPAAQASVALMGIEQQFSPLPHHK